jgi:hypothetical protein
MRAAELFRRALPAWLVSRLLGVSCWLITRAVEGGHMPRTGDLPDARGLWVWDAGWYRTIAEHGYRGAPHGAVRFFPLLPVAGRLLGHVIGTNAALLLIPNLCALGLAMLAIRLAVAWLPERAVPWVPWFVLLAPGALAFALAFTEPVWAVLCAWFLVAVATRERASWWAVPAGVLAGLARPTGVLLCVVPFLGMARRRRVDVPRVAATVAPVVGDGIFALWLNHEFGHPWLAYSSQESSRLRGAIVGNPLHALFTTVQRGGLLFPLLKVSLTVVVLVLVVQAWRLLPLEVWCWTTLLVLAAVTSANGESLPRYYTGDFPLLMTLAAVVRRPVSRALALSLCVALYVVVAVLAFTDSTVL